MKKNGFIRTLSIAAALVTAIAAVVPSILCFAQQGKGPDAGREVVYNYDTAGVRLEGILTQRTFYGPPGFGQTPAKDARDKVFVLKLPRPISAEPTADAEAKGSENLDPFEHVREVQLFVPRDKSADVRKLIGQTVVAVGTLREAVSPGQHTKITMDVSTLTPHQ